MSLYLKFLKCYYKTCLTPSLPGVGTSSWKYILQAQGKLWNEECYSQLKSCPLPFQTYPERNRIDRRGGENRQRLRRGELLNYLKFSFLSSSSSSVSWVITSESSQNTLSSPKEPLSLSVSISYWDPQGMGYGAPVFRLVSTTAAHSRMWQL